MAGASLRIDHRIDDRRVRRALQQLSRGGRNQERAFNDIGEALLNSTRDRMQRQVDPDGNPWEPLTPRYQKRKKRNKRKILVLWGRLFGRLTYQSGPDWAAVGTNVKYGATHQFGDEDRGIPERPYLGLSNDDRRTVVRILHRHIRRQLEQR